MKTVRSRLIAVFLAATIIPLIVAAAIMSSILDQSLSYTTTEELHRLSRSLEQTGRDYYLQAREALEEDARMGALVPQVYSDSDRAQWPEAVSEFWDSGESERFGLAGADGGRLDYFVRRPGAVESYSRSLGNVHMKELTAQIRDTRELVDRANGRDLRRGMTTVLLLLIAGVWTLSFAGLIYVANRLSQPIQQLTAGLSELAAGNLDKRIPVSRGDEIGRAIRAFNRTADELRQSRERLIYLTQVASWQMLARKMAHELKNSLTPIRLTVEEIRARQPAGQEQFMDKAVQIVISEVESLERRVRAFSEFSSEPDVRLTAVDMNGALEERVAFLRPGHPGIVYTLELEAGLPETRADPDRVNGILTNLLENAADAAGPAGSILCRSSQSDGEIHVEIHDSGPGLSGEARRTLFEPTITFKSGGMGLGLSIARKDALVCGGDLVLVEGCLGGAAFRLSLAAHSAIRSRRD